MPEPVYFHGGPAGLRVGGRVLPPAESGFTDSTAELAERNGWAKKARADRIYVTTEYMAAVMFASAHPHPTVYVVLPEGPLAPDPDCAQPGMSWECDRAVIVRVIRPKRGLVRQCRQLLTG